MNEFKIYIFTESSPSRAGCDTRSIFKQRKAIFIIKSIQTFFFIFIVILTTFWSIHPLLDSSYGRFRYILLNSGPSTELETEMFILLQ